MSEDWKRYIFDEDGRDKISFLIEQLQDADNKIEALEKYITNCTSAEIFFTDNTIKLKELEQKLEQKIALSPKTKEYYKGLEYRINELEEKLDSHINDFQLALRKIIYEHINTQGDEYGEDIQELLRMMDGFKKKLGKEVSEKSVPKSEEDFYKSDKGLTDDKASADLKELHNELNETKSVLRELQNEFDIIKTILPHLMDLYARNPDFMNELGLDFTKLKKLGTEKKKECLHQFEDGKCKHCGIPACIRWNYGDNKCLKYDCVACTPNCFDYRITNEPPQNKRTFEENFERIKKKEPQLPKQLQKRQCPKCGSYTVGWKSREQEWRCVKIECNYREDEPPEDDIGIPIKYIPYMQKAIKIQRKKDIDQFLADLLELKKNGELDKCMNGDILTIYLDDLNELIEKLQQEIDNYKKDLETMVSRSINNNKKEGEKIDKNL